jgi:hypothetical protein
MQHKKTAPTGVFQQSNKADFAVENKEETAAPSGIGSALSTPAKLKKAKKAEEATEVEVVEAVEAVTEAVVEAVAPEVVVEEPATTEESSDSK